MAFILSDISYKSFAAPGNQAEYANKVFCKLAKLPDGKWQSYALVQSGTNQNTLVNPTGPPGFCLGLYEALVFDMPKDGWFEAKVKETLDVTPVHHQYYELTHGRKEALEARLREGLVKISQSIADLELVRHDLIKYEDFEEQLKNSKITIEPKAKPDEKKKLEGKKRKAEMALKTIFMEEVDFHAGGSAQGGAGRLSMAFLRNHNIMPTVVDDFFRMSGKEDLKKDAMLKDLPTVEKRMLEVKWDAYQDWLVFFGNNVKRRMDALKTLELSRKKSLDEYRDWLKPTIARYRMIVDSLENAESRAGALAHPVKLNAMTVSLHVVKLWFWKDFYPPDPHRPPQEMLEKSGVVAFGKWERDNLYLHPDHGLITDYPWITENWIFDKAGIKDWGEKCSGIPNFSESIWYYSFQELLLKRTNFKTSATGSELEDGDFFIANYMMSKNIVAAKHIELKAMHEDLEIYIDDLLGLPHKIQGKPIIIFEKKEKTLEIDKKHYENIKKFEFAISGEKKIVGNGFPAETSFKSKDALKKAYPEDTFHLIERKGESEKLETLKQILGLDKVRFFLPGGPYEQNWSERIKKYYLKPNSARFEYLRNFFVSRMGIDA